MSVVSAILASLTIADACVTNFAPKSWQGPWSVVGKYSPDLPVVLAVAALAILIGAVAAIRKTRSDYRAKMPSAATFSANESKIAGSTDGGLNIAVTVPKLIVVTGHSPIVFRVSARLAYAGVPAISVPMSLSERGGAEKLRAQIARQRTDGQDKSAVIGVDSSSDGSIMKAAADDVTEFYLRGTVPWRLISTNYMKDDFKLSACIVELVVTDERSEKQAVVFAIGKTGRLWSDDQTNGEA